MWEPMIRLLLETAKKFPECKEKSLMMSLLEELKYRCWHNSKDVLPRWCYATDIDFLEWTSCGKGIELRGIIETKTPRTLKPEWQTEIVEDLGKKLGLPVWVTTFSDDLKKFELSQILPQSNYEILSEQDYIKFLIKLHQCQS